MLSLPKYQLGIAVRHARAVVAVGIVQRSVESRSVTNAASDVLHVLVGVGVIPDCQSSVDAFAVSVELSTAIRRDSVRP